MLAALIVMFSRFASRVMQCTERKLMDNIAELSHCLSDFYLASTSCTLRLLKWSYHLYYAEFLHHYQQWRMYTPGHPCHGPGFGPKNC